MLTISVRIQADCFLFWPKKVIFDGKPNFFSANVIHSLAGVRWHITTQSIVADWGCWAHGMSFSLFLFGFHFSFFC
jgi:hypothetical protein